MEPRPDPNTSSNNCLNDQLLEAADKPARAADAADAIRDMVVRGAPAIGIVAAYGLALEHLRGGDLQVACRRLLDSRLFFDLLVFLNRFFSIIRINPIGVFYVDVHNISGIDRIESVLNTPFIIIIGS